MVPDEANGRATGAGERLEPLPLLPVPHDDELHVRQRGGLDGEVHALPGRQPAHDADAERAVHALPRREVVGVDAVADHRHPTGEPRHRFDEHPLHVLADRDQPIGARGRPPREGRRARVEVVHHVMLGAKLRQAHPAGRARSEHVGAERVRVNDVDGLPRESVREPRDVGRAERAIEIRQRVLPGRPAIVNAHASRREVRGQRPVRRHESHLVVGAGQLRPGRQVDDDSLGATDVAPHDHMHHAKASHAFIGRGTRRGRTGPSRATLG